ncbi:MAG: fibronectin type III domain-containing protein [Flavisolibacter sp.]|nr:fibronectin type III domain-containing protein [Flavisolibacter sp.]
MAVLRIINGFDRLSDADLIARSRFIHGQMSGSVYFQTPDPTLETVLNAINIFEAALQSAGTGNLQDIAVKNLRRSNLISLLHRLGAYVLFSAQQDPVVATSSGFRIAKQPESGPAITNPQNVQIKNGSNSGELDIRFKKVPSARMYAYEYTPEPLTDGSVWKVEYNNLTTNTLSGLEVGKRYYCRIAAIGINKQVMYSDTISKVVS